MGDRRTASPLTVVAVLAAAACTASPDGARERTEGTSPDGAAAVDTSAKRADATAYLLPNVHSRPAEEVQIVMAADGTRELRFSATLSNDGDGPLVVAPDDDAGCPAGQRHASQLLVADVDGDGRYDPAVDTVTKRAPGGCMVDHPTHQHWHVDASASYRLTAPGDPAPIVASDKVSFCLRDSGPLDGSDRDGVYGDCDRESVQGISIGFGDRYGFELDGQALPLAPDLADGRYCLTLSADPDRLFRETDDGDNAATVGVELTGTTASAVPAPECASP